MPQAVDLSSLGGKKLASQAVDLSGIGGNRVDLSGLGGKRVESTIPKAGMAPPIPRGLQANPDDIPDELKSLTLGVDPLQFLQRAGGAIASVTNTLFPSGDVPSKAPTLPEMNPEEDIGAKAMTFGAITPPAIAATKAGVNAVRSMDAPQAISRRVIQSILKPDKSIAMMEADPVAEVMKLPVSRSVGQIKAKNLNSIKESEAKLQAALDERRAIARSEGLPMGIDIEPIVRDKVGTLIVQAQRNGEVGIARGLGRLMEARLNDIRKRLGSTYLTPEEILYEKRLLGEEVKFTSTEVVQQNKNAARLGMYRGYDHALDQLIPGSAEINRAYSGQIVADKLLDAKLLKMGNSDIFSGQGVVANLKKAIPEAPIKTGIARALRKPEAPPAPKAFEFHQPVDFRARMPGRLLNAAPEVPTDIPMGEGPTDMTQRLMGNPVTDAPSLPLPARGTGLDYGRGRYTDELQNWQYLGESTPSQLSRPEGPGVLRSTTSAEEHKRIAQQKARAAKAKQKERNK